MGIFAPRYIFENELGKFGLGGDSCNNPDLMSLVDTASIMIDEYCGRTDGDGNGSLCYTTYQERLRASPGRNVYQIPRRPLVAITPQLVADLQAADIASGGNIYTGVQASVNTLANGSLSAIISASGRYIYNRRDSFGGYDNMAFLNPLTMISAFGGPPTWQPIDMINLDYDCKTGDLWLPGGLYISRYDDAIVVYNAGYDPRNMPVQIKRACAAITKNLMAKGSGTTGMTSFSMSRSGVTAQFEADVIDGNVARLLEAFVSVKTA